MDNGDNDDIDSRRRETIHNASLDGAMFEDDSINVLAILKELAIILDAGIWMKGIDGVCSVGNC